ncbi:hypothetical protein GLYMA_09G168201v4 [Glycine max]|nr:hypothetical protein GLYMA_09G168201v4 [Glycine max]KAH1043380.1 hypothetical protein GYH30_025291 [Glycine max]
MSSCWTASIKMRHLRDNIVLLTALEGGDLNGMLQESEAWMGESFESIEPWNSFFISGNKTCCIRIVGVLLNAWSNVCFKQKVSIFGSFIKVDENTEKMASLEYARVMISTSSYDNICSTEWVKIHGNPYSFRVVEELKESGNLKMIWWSRYCHHRFKSGERKHHNGSQSKGGIFWGDFWKKGEVQESFL